MTLAPATAAMRLKAACKVTGVVGVKGIREMSNAY
jgi:hypothetical protein